MRQAIAFQVRPQSGSYNVFMTRADNWDIPVGEQHAVFTHKSRDRAQVISDALNNGLFAEIVRAVGTARLARKESA